MELCAASYDKHFFSIHYLCVLLDQSDLVWKNEEAVWEDG